MAYDTFASASILFSGVVSINGVASNPFTADTWSWDGTNWTQLGPTKSPLGRQGAGFAYTTATNVLVIFGGLPYTNYDFGDTWTY
jgi:hypothetical protein